VNTWILLAVAALIPIAALLISWANALCRLLTFYADRPSYRWADTWREPTREAAELDTEWRALGYEPLGTLLAGGSEDESTVTAAYRHPTLPVYGLVHARGAEVFACAMTFWEGGGTLITTAAPSHHARAAAVDVGAVRLVQLRVGGRPLALDGQHTGTVRAWALGKRIALPATRDALIPYLVDDFERVRAALTHAPPLPLRAHLQALLGRPERVLTF